MAKILYKFPEALTKYWARFYATKARCKSGTVIKKTHKEKPLELINSNNEDYCVPLLQNPTINNSKLIISNASTSIPTEHLSGKPLYFPLSLNKKDIELDLNYLANAIKTNCDKDAKIPSVTAILQKTMSEESALMLERWRKEMIKKLGIVGFAQYTKDTFGTGHALHKNIHDFLNGIPESQLNIEKNIEGHWKSVSTFLPKIKDVVALEKKLTHPYLNYVGVIDCIAKFEDKVVLIEWKTSQKPKPSLKHTYDNPVQLAAYLGSWNFNSESIQINHGLIVISYPDGNNCHVHEMNHKTCQHAWTLWLSRLSQYFHFEMIKSSEMNS